MCNEIHLCYTYACPVLINLCKPDIYIYMQMLQRETLDGYLSPIT